MKSPIILSALVHLLALFSPALADVTTNEPTSVSGGSGTVSAIQADDGVFYSAARRNTVNMGGFSSVGGDISSVVLHVKLSVDSGGYTGSNPIQVNGVNTPIVPMSGDTDRTASIDITAGNFRINTWPEITTLAVTFTNNDTGAGQSVHFDHAYLVINHSAPLFAPPTWSDEFNDSGPPNPAVWSFEQGFVRNQELQWYQSNNAWQENGNLIIEGRREQVLNPNYVAGSTDWRTNRQFAQYTSSSIISQGIYSFQYGRMQVRAKIPCFPGSWPAIWTLGNTGEWPSNGECDVLEYYSPDSVLANCARGTTTRWSAAWDAVKKPLSPFFTSTNPNPNWRTESHIWTMQWDENNVRLYIDNHLMNTTPQSWLVNPVTTWGPKEPFKQPHFLLLNLALGGAGGDPSGTTFPLRYEIDHVRVWEGLTGNSTPTDIALSSSSVPEGLPGGTVVGNLTATDVDAAEVHSFSLVSGTGDTHNSSFEVVFNSDQTKTSVLRTKTVLSSANGATRSIRVRVTDIEGATSDKILTVQLAGQYVIEVAPVTLAVPEGGTNTFDVRLRVAPAADVTVNVSRVSGDSDLNVASGSSLIFTPANGTAWQTVTLSAAEDADRTNGTATFHCNDASGAFLNATVIASETDNEPPPIQAVVVLSNLNQTFDGFMKSVPVTISVDGVPQNLSHDLTYGGQFMPPTDAGTYEVVATITDPAYQGSASGELVVAKAAQTINFASFDPVPDNAAPFALTATASSNLTVSYTSSNTNVATLSGSTLTIAGPGSSIITASQEGNDNYDAATSVPQTLTVFRANPLANLTWDSNGTAALQTDGAGDWTTDNQWWNGSSNTNWTSGDDAIFGSSGVGGEVTLASPTTVNSLTFNAYSGTYTLGSAGQIITLINGITKNTSATGTATMISPITLGAAQSWTNLSPGLLSIGPEGVANSGFLLSVGGTGDTTVSGPIDGAGGLTKSGTGTLSLTGSSAYSGTTTVSDGTLILSNANTISASTGVATAGILQLGHGTSMGVSTMTLASGATLQLRNDANTTFIAPINDPTDAVTYNLDVDHAASAETGKTLTLGNLTFATSTTGSVTNRINVTGGNGYILGLGTLSTPSSGGSAHPLIIHTTTASVAISRVSSGSYGTALNFSGSSTATLGDFMLGSNGNQSIIVNGPTVTLGTTTAAANRNSLAATAAYTLTSGNLNLTTTSSIANLKQPGSGSIVAPTFTIHGGTLHNTSGAALVLGTASANFNNNPAITLGGSFAFGSSSATSANNLNLGTGAVTNAGNRTITLNGTGTTLTLGGAMTNGVAGTQTTTVNGAGNTLTLGAYNLSNSTTARTGTFAGSGNITITGVVANSSGGAPASNLTYSGTGTLTLGGQNTYSGNTMVSQGTLLVTGPGSLAAGSAVTVGSGTGGTLGGNGTIHGSVTVAADGSLAPGAPHGTLTIGGTLDISAPTISGTGKLSFELDALATNNDQLAVAGILTIGAGALGFSDFAFTNLGGLQVTGGTPYKLITSGGIAALNTLDPADLTGTLPGGLTGTLQINGNDIELAVTNEVTGNYLSWATANGVTGGENGDSDNDGVTNLAEYALVDGGERGELNGHTITFTKRGGLYGSDISYDIESSTLLTAGSWSTLAKPPVLENPGSISYTFTPGSPPKQFARLKVVKAP